MRPGQQEGDEADIRQLIADAQKHQFDVLELLKLHDDEAVIVNMAGRRVFGKAAFGEAMTQALSSSLRQVPATVAVDRVQFLSPDSALVSCRKTVQDLRPATERTALPGSEGVTSYVVVRQGKRWVIALAQTTAVRV
ncbi:SgcJ/EcaC family oxidoreductase [Piscinibacter sp. XHJ-5]|uniref:SgcJ/EcaC family oxidoreductase n=1 Tax=Piscinibacter sp. XHJ-5 TaxID=3037797 RepID=UPI00245339E9|nr:SgcJ/EcaC family oxidoreductase [Piscinibacter sp. XHJ-5]